MKVRFEEIPEGVLPDMGARVAFLSEPVPEAALEGEAVALRVPAGVLALLALLDRRARRG
ncbi:MAG TPA: hypothetical protein VLQ93_03175 [Myxococcaceae bacterium]|nr:hypothetical protein [Myxococcaceae bacterium]